MRNVNHAISRYWVFVAGSQSQYWLRAGDASSNHGYGIFRNVSDGRPLWTAHATTLVEAKQMLENLAGVMPSEYFACNVATGEIVARIPADVSEGVPSQRTRPQRAEVTRLHKRMDNRGKRDRGGRGPLLSIVLLSCGVVVLALCMATLAHSQAGKDDPDPGRIIQFVNQTANWYRALDMDFDLSVASTY